MIDSEDICICVRYGTDHPGRFFNMQYFNKAIDYFDTGNNKIYLLSDTYDLNIPDNFIKINECDVIQYYFGLMCSKMVLSCSTYHIWIAYCNNAQVIYNSNNGIFKNKNIKINHWIDINTL